jgi:voltage-gated potassium channel
MAKKSKSLLKRMGDDEDKLDRKLFRKESKIEQNILKKIRSYFHLHMDNYTTTHGRWIEGSLFLLNFVALFLFVLDTYNFPGFWGEFVWLSEVVVVSVFAVEYLVRMWIAEKKVKHFFNVYSIIDLLSIAPILVNFVNLAFFRIFRILRLIRLVRILRFQRMFQGKDTILGKFTESQLIVTRIVLTVFTIIFVSSGLIWAVESKINPEYGTIFSAIYFSVVTLSTVGFGDITPLSPLGQAITIAMILTGIALIPWQLGKLVKVVVLSASKVARHCKKCGLDQHDPDAIHCKQCGKLLSKKWKEKKDSL